MPLKSVKSSVKKKPQSKPSLKAKAPKSKPKLRSVKPKLEAKSGPKKSPGKSPPKSILWQILEERKKQQGQAPPQPYKTDSRGQPQPLRHQQFAKFAGPRRRAA